MKKFPQSLLTALMSALVPNVTLTASEPPQPVTVTISEKVSGAPLSSLFLGLSYETSMELPDKEGRYYFDSGNTTLVNLFRTLGIKSLRIGGNAVDDPRAAIPQEKDIDHLFGFARAADVKVIYSFRLKNGDPALSARQAAYIAAHYPDELDCFAIGNESSSFLKPYSTFFTAWKAHYDAIIDAVPNAKFDGPSDTASYALKLVENVSSEGHLVMASDHNYFFGGGRKAETDPAATRARFLSNASDSSYKGNYGALGAKLAVAGVPYRMDEINSCSGGGAKDSSDTYASTLWLLDCTHWWAAHHLLGMNYHTGESVGRDGGFNAPNYAAFLRQNNSDGFVILPLSYGLLAFSQGAQGLSLDTTTQMAQGFDFTSYAYRKTDGSILITVINKSYGDNARVATVTLHLPAGLDTASWQQMSVMQNKSDVASKTDVTLGGEAISTKGIWAGHWDRVERSSSGLSEIQVAPASATLFHFFPAK